MQFSEQREGERERELLIKWSSSVTIPMIHKYTASFAVSLYQNDIDLAPISTGIATERTDPRREKRRDKEKSFEPPCSRGGIQATLSLPLPPSEFQSLSRE